MHILVYGAGVLGSLYAARLAESGNDVTVLARGQRLAELREHGIVLEDEATGRESATPVRVVPKLAEDDAYELVMVVVRRDQVGGVLPALAANRRTPNVLFMVNNAAGPDEYVRALGRERVLLGFPGAGGAKEGHVVRCRLVSSRVQPTTLGELDGLTTTRLTAVADALRRAGFPVELSPNMDAWLKTHVAVVSPIANAIYTCDGDNYRLARSREGVTLCVRAIKEGFRVLRALDIPLEPVKFKLLRWIPDGLLVAALQRTFGTRNAELVMARHANTARDEMKCLADEFRELTRQTSLTTPAIDRLCVCAGLPRPQVEGSGRR